MTARSTAASTAPIDGTAARPWTIAARGLTGTMRPAKPAARRLASTLPPIFEESRDAPMTATHRGWKNGPSDGRVTRGG
jgi:hypothetical protein